MASTHHFAGGPLEPPRSLTATLVARLREEITSGRIGAGMQLPSENQLVRTFGVSRTVVREAVAALRAEGLVTTRRGRGAFVAERRQAPPFTISAHELSSLEDVLAVLELRTALEVEAAALAAERREPADLAAIADAEMELDAQIGLSADSVEADFAFHLAIARATHNPYFARLLESLGSALIPRGRVRADLVEADVQRDYLVRIAGEHRAIEGAIRAGDPGRARRAMQRHLEGSRYRVLLRSARG
jgi:DNA-binding FadR family transcriptional regulator